MARQKGKAATNVAELPKFLDLLSQERVFCGKKSICSPDRAAFRSFEAAFLEGKGGYVPLETLDRLSCRNLGISPWSRIPRTDWFTNVSHKPAKIMPGNLDK
jgi:hypothetical protein